MTKNEDIKMLEDHIYKLLTKLHKSFYEMETDEAHYLIKTIEYQMEILEKIKYGESIWKKKHT